MKRTRFARAAAHLLVALGIAVMVCAVGCGHRTSVPEEIAVEEVPGALDNAFVKAEPGTRQLVRQVTGNLNAQNYPLAYRQLQSLSSRSGLTPQQSQMAARALLSVNQRLQAAQRQGDPMAANELKRYRVTK